MEEKVKYITIGTNREGNNEQGWVEEDKEVEEIYRNKDREKYLRNFAWFERKRTQEKKRERTENREKAITFAH